LEDDVKGALKMNAEEMKTRTKEFAKDIINLCRKLPNNREGRLIGNQVFKSGTSVAANYRAACRGRSKAEFIAKLGIVEEEADETLFWLEIIEEMNIYDPSSVDSLMQECDEIIAIMVSSVKTAKRTRKQA
jgi:four helix bundle protein